MSGEERPVPPKLPCLDQVPEELRHLKRWVGWRAAWDESKHKWRKPPHSPVTGEAIGAVEKWAEHWLTFEEVVAGVVKHSLDGVGFVFKDGDGYVGIDFDECREAGVIHQEVQSWLKWLPTYQEVSPSGTGVHAIAKGRIAKALTATALPNGGKTTVEMYCSGRYFTFTGLFLGDAPKNVGDSQVGIEKLKAVLVTKDSGVAEPEAQRPMSKLTARKIYADNLAELRACVSGGNNLLNTCAFFASRAFYAGALEATVDEAKDWGSLQQELLDVVTKEWKSPHPEDGARGTIRSGWGSGKSQPLIIGEEEFPQVLEAVEELNKLYFLIFDFGGKGRVGWEVPSTIGKGKTFELRTQSIGDFKLRYLRHLIETGFKDDGSVRLEDKATVWIRHKHCRAFERVVFEPCQKTEPHLYNLWKGFAYEPKKGDCRRYLEHLSDNICQGDTIKYDYLIGWMANTVRFPHLPGQVAIAVQGLKGVGKNVFAEKFNDLWGSHGLIVSDQVRITNNFNAHLRDKVVLVGDEAFFAGDRRHEGNLKALITGPTITIEAKGVDPVTVPNLLHIIILGNDTWLVPASADERRYLMLSCSDAKRGNQKYFQAITAQMDNGGYGALLHHLLHEVNLTDFNVREAPHTDELRMQMVHNLRDVDAAWFQCLHTGLIPGRVNSDLSAEMCTTDFIDWARLKADRWSNIRVQNVGLLLGTNPKGQAKGFGYNKVRELAKGKQLRFWNIPQLSTARRLWDEIRFKFDWPKDGGEWESIAGQDVKF